MDFYQIRDRTSKKGNREIFPEFKVCRSQDLMVRGKAFYAIWDPDKGLWSTDEYDVQRLVDRDLWAYYEEHCKGSIDYVTVLPMANFSSNSWLAFRSYVGHVSDNAHTLDNKLTFLDTKVKKTDYVSKRLPYNLGRGDCPAWDEMVGTLYDPDERAKIEWAIGSIVAGDSKDIQKFIVFYGKQGSGKSTIMNIIEKLFEGYYVVFDAKALTTTGNQFATEVFKTNPLVAIQQDGDLSRIEDNSRLNSIVSHELMVMNEKFKPQYSARANSFLFMGTNKPVKITDAKSGLIRRLIDVHPSNRLIPRKKYDQLYSQIDFELGAIAQHCLDVYLDMGKHYYDRYVPIDMMYKTDEFFNFVEDSYLIFSEQDGTSLKAAYAMYVQYCEESGAQFKMQRYKFREELKNYFRTFEDMARIDGKQIRSWYSGFRKDKFERTQAPLKAEIPADADVSCG